MTWTVFACLGKSAFPVAAPPSSPSTCSPIEAPTYVAATRTPTESISNPESDSGDHPLKDNWFRKRD
eukprot:CAMPEP_0114294712 /NCGR_PEP_ID=MMETSP0059-20121206/10281_1 /TAXON_ID=36894 /ORGANISM="Pyramimonas parkeae, Strain CCMP726" /LENGTH=66 /DNA_ID=CAMNT_0001416525 /DNA_START=926 /DNA_END=1123 /DNA_ORIENTATION=-